MKAKLSFLLPLGVFLGLLGLFIVNLGKDPSVLDAARLDQPLPDFSLPSLRGDTLTAAAIASDNITLVNVFASWCQPCWLEHETLMALREKQGLRIIGWAYKDSPEKINGFLNQLGNPYAFVLMDTEGRAAIDLGVYGAPETYVINSEGIIKARFVGGLNEPGIYSALQRLLEDLGA